MGNHIDHHLVLALEVLSLISGAIDSTDDGVAIHLAELARDRAAMLYERLEVVQSDVGRDDMREHVERLDRILDESFPPVAKLRRVG